MTNRAGSYGAGGVGELRVGEYRGKFEEEDRLVRRGRERSFPRATEAGRWRYDDTIWVFLVVEIRKRYTYDSISLLQLGTAKRSSYPR